MNELIYKTETDITDIENEHSYVRVRGWGRDKLGIWDQPILLYVKIDKQQGPTVQHRELYKLYSLSYNKP